MLLETSTSVSCESVDQDGGSPLLVRWVSVLRMSERRWTSAEKEGGSTPVNLKREKRGE